MRADPAVRKTVGACGIVAAFLALVYLLTPPLGTDLSAQVARADFIREYGFRAIDLRWYGGTVQYGYSIVAPAVMAVLGPRPAGALAAVVSSVVFAVLLLRTNSRRPLLAGVLATVCFFGNLVSGRVTFALGVACGLGALLSLAFRRRWLAVVLSVVAAATSPVAGLFLILVGASLCVVRVWRHGLVVAVPPAFVLALVGLLFGDGGWMNISISDMLHAVVASLAVALVVPRPAVRVGGLLSAAGVLAAFVVHTPVGLNATRLATMFALPVVAGYGVVRLPVWPTAFSWLGLAALAVWQPPVLLGDLLHGDNPANHRSYYAPLLAELQRRTAAGELIGRIEVPPTYDYWESTYVADAVPLARGWLRQVDLARNGVFFDGSLNADRYRTWLQDNGVSYVALPDTRLSWVGRREGELIRGGLPYLSEAWRSAHWVLYRVDSQPSIVDGARLVTVDGASVTFDADAPGDVLVRVRWLRWLRLSGPAGSMTAGPDGWTVVHVRTPGRFTVSS